MDAKATGRELESETTTEKEIIPQYAVMRCIGSVPPQYEGMVISRWLRSLRYGNDFFKLTDKNAYYENYHPFLESILKRPYTVTRIAYLLEDPDVAFGFSVTEGETLHYVHVQKDYRLSGIGRSLIPNQPKEFTHLTKTGMQIWHNKLPKATFNPWK